HRSTANACANYPSTSAAPALQRKDSQKCRRGREPERNGTSWSLSSVAQSSSLLQSPMKKEASAVRATTARSIFRQTGSLPHFEVKCTTIEMQGIYMVWHLICPALGAGLRFSL